MSDVTVRPVRVTVGVGYTRNMGDFESLRLDFGIEDDVREGENVKTATERIWGFVSGQLTEKMKEIDRDLRAGK